MNKEISEYIVTGTVLRYDGCYDSGICPHGYEKKESPARLCEGFFSRLP